MRLLGIHPHAFKHGLREDEIEHAWSNAFVWLARYREDGNVDYVLIGPDRQGRLVELIARKHGGDGYLVFHARRPPTRKALAELGLDAKR